MASYLQKRRERYYAVLEIPKPLRSRFGGKPRFVKSLETDSLTTAQRRVGPIVGGWQAEIDRAGGNTIQADSDAAFFHKALQRARSATEREAVMDQIRAKGRAVWGTVADDGTPIDWETVFRQVNKARDDITAELMDQATAIETSAHLDDYLTGARGLSSSTKDMHRGVIGGFAKVFPLLRDVERGPVRAWVNGLLAGDLAAGTVRRHVSAVRSYWRYLESVGAVAEDQGLFDKLTIVRQGQRGAGDKRRPFAPAEIVTLWLASQAAGEGVLADLIWIAAHTGARIEELCSLKVSEVDLKAGSIRIVDAKTATGNRTPPIHSAIHETMVRLLADSKDGFVLQGLPSDRYGRRQDRVGRRFTALKRMQGFGPLHVFHSIRKTVATMLENAGVSENLAADILGHEKPRITYGLYSGGADLETKRAAIEKLAYPA